MLIAVIKTTRCVGPPTVFDLIFQNASLCFEGTYEEEASHNCRKSLERLGQDYMSIVWNRISKRGVGFEISQYSRNTSRRYSRVCQETLFQDMPLFLRPYRVSHCDIEYCVLCAKNQRTILPLQLIFLIGDLICIQFVSSLSASELLSTFRFKQSLLFEKV